MMKKLFISLFTAVASLCVMAQPSQVINAAFDSEILGVEKPYTIYIPAGYDESGDNYPVLYLLHGAWGCDRDWTKLGNMKQIADEAIASGMAKPMIIVMPDARGEGENYAGHNMGYFNRPDWEYERYFFEELVPYIDSHYRTQADREHRAIAGLSMGGGGSVMYGQNHPDQLSAVVSMSGVLGSIPGRLVSDEYSRDVERTDPTRFVYKADDDTAAKLKSVRWLVMCGDDDILNMVNVDFYKAMHHAGIPIEFRMSDGGHTWRFWQQALPVALTFVSTSF